MAVERATATGASRLSASARVWRAVIGHPLRFRDLGKQQITPVEGLSELTGGRFHPHGATATFPISSGCAMTGRSDRQVFSYGIVTLAVMSAALIVAVDGNTQRLIPMFAIGVFTGFTLAQLALVVHWRRTRPDHWRRRAAFNGLGAVVTGTATLIFLVTKFTAGGWLVLVAVPVFITLFLRIQRYYRSVDRVLRPGDVPPKPHASPVTVVISITGMNRLAEKALPQAVSLSDDVIALTVLADEGPEGEDRAEALRAAWRRWDPGVPLRILHTEYASVARPIVRFIDELHSSRPGCVAVVLPVVHPEKRRHAILHNRIDHVVAAALASRDDVMVTRVPITLDHDASSGPHLPLAHEGELSRGRPRVGSRGRSTPAEPDAPTDQAPPAPVLPHP